MNFLKANSGKLAVAIIILIAAGLLARRNAGKSSPEATLPNSIQYVDVTTGEIIALKRGQTVVLPRENPKTGERTLLPVLKRDGDYYVSDMRRRTLEQLGDKNKWVDPKTLRVRKPGS